MGGAIRQKKTSPLAWEPTDLHPALHERSASRQPDEKHGKISISERIKAFSDPFRFLHQMKIYFKTIVLLLLSTVPLAAQESSQSSPSRTGIGMGVGILGAFEPISPPSRVSVPPGDDVSLSLPGATDDPPAQPLQWTKNGVPISGATNSVLVLFSVTANDSGVYRVIPDLRYPASYLGIALDVAPSGHLTNVSSRLALKAGNDVQILGFVVTGTSPKRLLVRASGPSLAGYGVSTPAALPRIRIYDALGRPFGPTVTPGQAAAIDWAGIFRQVGAFPLTGGERLYAMARFLNFPPGVYSVHVSDDAGQGGTVLVETYELP
jgi:hypothetical protein